MLRWLAILTATLNLFGAVDFGGHASACQSRPCVYTVTCTGTPRVGSIADIQTAVDDAHRGDTIRLEAGCTWNGQMEAVWIDRDAPGTEGRVVITSTAEDKLPAPGTRITPAYWPLVPRLQIAGTNGPFFAIASGFEGSSRRTTGVAAKHWELRGLGFWVDVNDPLSTTDVSNGFVRVGSPGGTFSKAGEHFTALTVSGGIATATLGPYPHSFFPGDKIRMSGLTGASAGLNGIKAITQRVSGQIFRFDASGVPDGTYTEQTMYFSYPADASQAPEDIVIERCIFQQGGLTKVRRDLLINGGSTMIRDSFISAGRSAGGDSQHILTLAGLGKWSIENNYVAGAASESIMFGGDANHSGEPVSGINIRFNYIGHVPEQAWSRTWQLMKSDPFPVVRGRVVRPTTDNGWFYIARNTGTLGSVEPDWSGCKTPGCTVSDGSITWERFYASSTCSWCIKNNFEVKSARDVKLTHNVFEYMWNAGQNRAINIKSEQQSLYPNFGNNCVPTLMGTVNTSGTTVTLASGTLPWQSGMATAYGVNPMLIRINDVDYTIASFNSAQTLTLTASAGEQTNVPFRYGTDPKTRFCQAAETRDLVFSHNIVRSTSSVMSVFPGTNANRLLTGGFTIRHNLFEKTDPKLWTNTVGLPYHTDGNLAHFMFLPIVDRFVMDHNTVTGTNNGWGIYAETWQTVYPGDSVITNNVFDRNLFGFFRGGEHTDLALMMCGGTSCPKNQWDRNVLIGANIATYKASEGAVGNLCLSASGCTSPDYSLLFLDPGNLEIKPGTAYSRNSTDGADYGADLSQVAEIRDLTVTSSDRSVLFRYRVTEPIADIPCVVELSPSPDFSIYAGELEQIASWGRQDADDADRFPRDGRRRAIVLGHSVPLNPATRYYYRLHCGGDLRSGSFTTEAALAGPQQRSLSFQPAAAGSQTLSWGYSYSRSTDQIAEPRTATVVCTDVTSCSVPFEIEKGRVYYWRIENGPVQVDVSY